MREIAPFGLRMPIELKDRLANESKANGRSMNSEVLARLWDSFETQKTGYLGQTAKEPGRAQSLDGLTDIERQLLTIFRRLPIEKQLALVSLFK